MQRRNPAQAMRDDAGIPIWAANVGAKGVYPCGELRRVGRWQRNRVDRVSGSVQLAL